MSLCCKVIHLSLASCALTLPLSVTAPICVQALGGLQCEWCEKRDAGLLWCENSFYVQRMLRRQKRSCNHKCHPKFASGNLAVSHK